VTDEPEASQPSVLLEASASGEVLSLVRELGRAYVDAVRFYRTQLGKSVDEADWALRELTAYDLEQLPEAPADQVSWLGLTRLMEHKPELGMGVWQRIKEEARAELDGGHRAASAMEWDGSPWDRARFLAIRQAFRDEWHPQGGVEDALIDTLAQAHSAYLTWLGIVQVRTSIDVKRTDRNVQRDRHWEPQRLDEAAAVEQAAAMVERFNRLFLRTLRALRDLRRYTPTVVVQHAQQVNVAGQQLNTAVQTDGGAGGTPIVPTSGAIAEG
jgi:hypothetical protein